jgi:hypothetical protein
MHSSDCAKLALFLEIGTLRDHKLVVDQLYGFIAATVLHVNCATILQLPCTLVLHLQEHLPCTRTTLGTFQCLVVKKEIVRTKRLRIEQQKNLQIRSFHNVFSDVLQHTSENWAALLTCTLQKKKTHWVVFLYFVSVFYKPPREKGSSIQFFST